VLEHYPGHLIAEVEAVGSHARVLLNILTDIVPVWEGAFGANLA
jgi:hypothetical protein